MKPSTQREAEAEIRRLKGELAIAREERDILKKAIQVFTQEQKQRPSNSLRITNLAQVSWTSAMSNTRLSDATKREII